MKRSSLAGFLPFYLLFLQVTGEKENNIHEVNQAEEKTLLFLQVCFFFMHNAVEHIKTGCWLQHMPYKPWYICSQRDVVEQSCKD